MKRALVILTGALLLALLLVSGVAVFLAATEGGTRLLAGQAERFLPIRIEGVAGALLREVRVQRIEYTLPNQRLEIEGLVVRVETMPLLFDSHLIVHAAAADAVTLTRTGEPDSAGPPPELRLPYMPLTIDLRELVVERLTLPGVFPVRVTGSASWAEQGVAIHRLDVIGEPLAASVQGRLGSGDNPSIAAQMSWSLPGRDWSGEGRLEGRVDDFELSHLLRGYVSVEAQGRGSLANVTDPYVDVRVAVSDLEFGDTAIRGITGRVYGTPSNATADAGARVQAPHIEAFDLEAVAYGPAMGPLTLRNVSANALGGVQDAQGSVSWRDGVRVYLGGTANDVSLAALREELRGRVSAGVLFRYDDGLVELGLQGLSGTLNGRPIEGAVEVAQLAEGWSFDSVRLNVGDNRLAGHGRISGTAVEVEAEVNAPALAALGLPVSGDAVGSVRLTGTWPKIGGTVALSSSLLEGYGVTLRETTVRATLTDGALDGTMAAARVSREQLTLDRAHLAAAGPLERVDLRLRWEEGEVAGSLLSRDDGIELAVNAARTSLVDQQWSLRNPTRVLLQDQRLEVAPACVAGGGASACVEAFVWDAGRLETRGTLERAPVALFAPWLPVRLGDEGYLEGGWNLAGEPEDLSGALSVAARQLRYLPGEEQEAIDLPDLEVNGDVTDGALELRLAATDEAFSVTGRARLAPVERAGSLTGTIEAAATQLEPLKVFDQRLEDIAGSVQGELILSGTLAEPRMEGRLMLVDGRVALNDPDLALTSVNVRLLVNDTGAFDLRGTAVQEEDEVLIAAAGAGLFGEPLRFDAALKGQRIEARHPDWEVTVSPDLTFDYAEGLGRLRGRVEVPEAEVRVAALPTSVPSPSDDVVVVGREGERGGNAGTNPLRADVEVVLGDDVTLKALGLTAQLEGALRARLDAQGRTTLRGTLDITEGVLTTQGQTLTIESGTVAYNGPVTRPYIDVRAVRVIEDVTPEVRVGLHIRGDANNLTSSVFSEPVMSETRALSFLILGRDLDAETTTDDSSQLVAAAINLGLARSKGITSELMRMTGLDELSAKAEAEDSFAIVAGKRITDDLYVRYTYNTLSAVGAFLVRYDLGDGWQLEAHSGEQSAMDLMYSIEK